MSAKNSKLYFVALIPTGDVLRKVRKLKEEVAERYESKAALKSPPHITLHMPFKFREDREDRIEEVLRKVAISFGSFTVFLPGFGAFPPESYLCGRAKDGNHVESQERADQKNV